jgi:hypothetical protein
MAHKQYQSPATGDGSTTEFALPVTVLRPDDVTVYVNGVFQHPLIDYNVRGFNPAAYPGDTNRIKFTSAPTNLHPITILANGG